MEIDNKKCTRFQKIISRMSILLIIAIFLFIIVFWNRIPERIPGHYDGSGNITRLDPKWTILFLPILSVIFYFGLSAVENTPSIWTVTTDTNEDNKDYIYRITVDLLVSMKFVIIATFCYITINNTYAKKLSSYFLPIVLGLVFGVIILYIVRSIRNGRE